MLNTKWQLQCQAIEQELEKGSTTLILGIKDLLVQDIIAAKRALQTISTVADQRGYNLASLSRDLLIITPSLITWENWE